MYKNKCIARFLSCAFVLGFFSIAFSTQAAILNSNAVQSMQNNTKAVQEKAGFDASTDVTQVAATAIKGFLGVLGIIFIILILIAGFNWMTAAGDEEKIKKATATIRAAIIGLLIIVSAYAITYFIFSSLSGSPQMGTPG